LVPGSLRNRPLFDGTERIPVRRVRKEAFLRLTATLQPIWITVATDTVYLLLATGFFLRGWWHPDDTDDQ
jgi:hypothetical protein